MDKNISNSEQSSSLVRLTILQKQFRGKNPLANVVVEESPCIIKISFNNPKQLNRLTQESIQELYQFVTQLSNHKSIKALIFKSTGGSFCGGWDFKYLYQAKKQGSPQDLKQIECMFRQLFTTCHILSKSLPTQITIYNGIVMGCGVGLSINSQIRIATDNSVFAMTEAKLGFFPDLGAAYFLTRMRKRIGLYLAMTGAWLQGKQLYQCGAANYYVPNTKLQQLEIELMEKIDNNTNEAQIHQIVSKYSCQTVQKYPYEDLIEEIFNAETFEGLILNLQTSAHTVFTHTVINQMKRQNAISLRVIFEQMNQARKLDFKENLKMDFRLSQRFLENSDFIEGIRVNLIEKKGYPQWKYKSPLQLKQEEVQNYFKFLPPEQELNI